MLPRAVGMAISGLRAETAPSLTTVRRPAFHACPDGGTGMEGLVCATNPVTSISTLQQSVGNEPAHILPTLHLKMR